MLSLYILAGANGAGKSSIGLTFLPEYLREDVFDGDRLFISKRNEL